jgi:O-succinylhomoserine sulfhydrylase
MSTSDKHFATRAIRTQPDRAQREHSEPLYLTSSFVYDDAEQARALFANELSGNMYSRFSNPNTDALVEKLCLLEETEDGFATATGMAAVFASLAAFLRSGDHVVASRALFGSSHQILTQILPRWGIEHTYIDGNEPADWEAAIGPQTRMLMLETPSNPGLQVIDMEMLGGLAHRHGLLYAVDNCFATPYLQQPARYGADLVIHSATKFIDGQGRVVGGAVLGSKELIREVRFFCRQTGPAMSPFNAWVLSKSLETLHVRMDRHCASALALARRFQTREDLEEVRYPFLETHPQYTLARKQMAAGGGLLCLVLKGGYERARRFIDRLQMLSHTANLGDSRTIVTHPASTTHSKLSEEERQAVNIPQGLIRISVGLEHIDDIAADVEQALEASRAAVEA